MAINYKNELEAAAKTMILVHNQDVLIKMIVRMIVQKVKVRHAGILLHNKELDTYVLTVSRGPRGVKIPKGFARMDTDNPLVRFFREGIDKQISKGSILVYAQIQKILSQKNLEPQIKLVLNGALYQMEIFETNVCIPSYFRDDLLGILLLGEKINGNEFRPDELTFFSALASDVAMALRNAQLIKQLQGELSKKQELFMNTVAALGAAIEAKDHYTRGHTERVTNLSIKIAAKLTQKDELKLHDKFLEQLRIAALLHDIGKIGIAENILNKKERLTDEEREKIQLHSNIGATILQPIKEFEESILGVKYHHERYDGKGYPEGLKGERIPLIASIIAIADAFDAMISDRPYRKGMAIQEAVKNIKQESGKQFNPQVVACLIELYNQGEIC